LLVDSPTVRGRD